MLRPYSTKRVSRVPTEFRQFFIENGWTRSDNTFGKRETQRYVTALGRIQLCAERREYRRQQMGRVG